jgi:hypothetical protein
LMVRFIAGACRAMAVASHQRKSGKRRISRRK